MDGGKAFREPDTTLYSMEFFNALRQAFPDAVLQDSLVLLGDAPPFAFPSLPAIGKRYTLTAAKDGLAIALHVTRLNHTTIDYKVELAEFGRASHTQHGRAHLSPSFLLGSEIDESSLTGLAYGATEFVEDGGEGCRASIRIGVEPESGPYLLGKLIKNCNGRIQDISLSTFPTLIEK